MHSAAYTELAAVFDPAMDAPGTNTLMARDVALAVLDDLILYNEQIIDIAGRDHDTSLYVPAYLQARLAGEWERGVHNGSPLGIVRVDIAPHGGIDEDIARLMADAPKGSVIAGRIQPTTVLIVLPDAEREEVDAMVARVGDRLAPRVANHEIEPYSVRSAQGTPSLGIEMREFAMLPPGTEPPRPLGHRFSGLIVAATDTSVEQDVGRGEIIAHPRSLLDHAPEPGHVVRITYGRDGNANVEAIEPDQGPELSR